MHRAEIVAILVFLMVIVILYHKIKYRNRVYVQSDIDNMYYMVRDRKNKKNAANLLAKLRLSLQKVIDYMAHKVLYMQGDTSVKVYGQYIDTLKSRFVGVVITESPEDSKYTSYCVNKGDEIVFCIRPKHFANHLDVNDTLHDINLIMYVALHEISHIACPERDHTTLFKRIFSFICKNAIELGVYKKINFAQTPAEYCGITIHESIV